MARRPTDEQPVHATRLVRRMQRRPLTPRRAVGIIAASTVIFTVLGALLIWLVDRHDFPTPWAGLWWSLQTVTTVGYGDVVPTGTAGKFIAAVVMLVGIAFMAIVTAAVTAALIDATRGRSRAAADHALEAQLSEIGARLAAIERAVEQRRTTP